MVSLSYVEVFLLSWHHRFVLLGPFKVVQVVLNGVVERVREKLVGAALLAQHFVVHLSVAFECGLETCCPVVFVVKVRASALRTVRYSVTAS